MLDRHFISDVVTFLKKGGSDGWNYMARMVGCYSCALTVLLWALASLVDDCKASARNDARFNLLDLSISSRI
jgi:hypothetical protein